MTATDQDTPGDAGLSADELVAVAAVMTEAGEPPAAPLRARLVSGGRSNLTVRLDDGEAAWVLRTPPRAGRTPSAHDVAREFRVTRALGRAGVPVPPAVALSEDESLIGGPFAVARFVEGRSLQSADDLAGLPDDRVEAAVAALADALARLHEVDHVAVGLERFGRPDGYAARQLKRWSGQWEIVGEAQPEPVRRAAAALAARLGERLPEQRSTGIVHGDYRIDNTLLRVPATGPVEVAAIVDWELSTIGDPVADVAMMCVYRHPAFDQVLGFPSAWTEPRVPDVAGLAAAYERAGGVPLVDLERHLALGYYKLAVIAAGIDHRHRAAGGEGLSSAGESVGPLLDAGLAVDPDPA
ncbi:phosphotransferase family protein [Nocardioides sp. Leaf374]|uniref:phosphotransferase family protein n=1 Tax=Nocardioides sp. Leaf374 TaxID=2876560 RepID=UPI001E45778B|nr:phosphotransferase family protein [Nocardioides sp. Leaf374]